MPRILETQYPEFIPRDSNYLHTAAVQPAIQVLADPRFKGANEEFLRAIGYHRNSDFAACLNECLKAFESTMKIICHHKGWAYNQNDTASKLVGICICNNLLPSYNQQHLTSLRTLLESTIPTQRNKQSGHGQGVQQNVVNEATAKFALTSTGSTIVFLVEAANL